MNRYQLQRFREVTAALRGRAGKPRKFGGVFLGADYHFDLTRPGIAVYGGEAIDGAVNPMKAVVTAEARIVQVRTVPSGETASYGASVRFGRDSRIATVAIGYADGYHRSVSGGGVTLRQAMPLGRLRFLHGMKVPHVGR